MNLMFKWTSILMSIFLYIYIIHFSLLLPLVPQKDNN